MILLGLRVTFICVSFYLHYGRNGFGQLSEGQQEWIQHSSFWLRSGCHKSCYRQHRLSVGVTTQDVCSVDKWHQRAKRTSGRF